MPTLEAKNAVQKLYVAFYARPADPSGLDFWANIVDQQGGSINGILNSFVTSPEADALYGNKSTGELVSAIYQNVLGRNPEAAGLAYWTNVINSGASAGAVIMGVLTGAQAQDAQTVVNKLDYANTVTHNLIVYNMLNAGPTIEVARTQLKTITFDVNTETQAILLTNDAITATGKNVVPSTGGAASPPPIISTQPIYSSATTFDIKSSADGAVSLYNGATKIGSSTSLVADTTKSVTVAAQGTKVEGVTVEVTNTSNIPTTATTKLGLGTTGDDSISGTSGVDIIYGFDGNDVITGGAGADAMDGGAGDDQFVYNASSEMASGEKVVGGSNTATGDSLVLKGTSQTYDLKSNLTMTGVEKIDTSAAVTAMNITMTDTQASDITAVTGGAATEQITISIAAGNAGGQKAVNISSVTLTSLTAGTDKFILTADAIGGTTTGYAITTSALGDTVTLVNGANTVTGGAGVDTFNGGSGNDVFAYTTQANLVSGGAFVDSISGNGGTDEIKITAAAAFTIGNGDSWSRVTSVEKVTAGPSAGAISITLNDNVTAAGLTTIDLSGDTNAAGANTIDTTNDTTGGLIATIKGSAGADTIKVNDIGVTIDGGAGDDTIYSGAGNDNITLGAGNDTYVIKNDGTANKYPNNGADTITDFLASGTDKINVQAVLAGFANTDQVTTPANFVTAGLDLTGKSLGVVFNKGTLSAADIQTTAAINKICITDNARAIVLATADSDGVADGTAEGYNIYFIVDTDPSAAQSWQVTLIGTLSNTTELAAATVAASGNFI